MSRAPVVGAMQESTFLPGPDSWVFPSTVWVWWGFWLSWVKPAGMGPHLNNARLESMASNAMFEQGTFPKISMRMKPGSATSCDASHYGPENSNRRTEFNITVTAKKVGAPHR